MVSLLTFMFIGFMEWLGKSFQWFLKVCWWFCKIIGFLVLVSCVVVIDMAMLPITLLIWAVCRILKKTIPKIRHTKWWVFYPSWNSI